MADAAAFFAKKKKKKKTFKFNANTIDASQVTNTVHVDAPALSNTADLVPTTGALPLEKDAKVANDDNWDDEALAANTMRKGAAVVVPAGVTTKDLVVETKALSLKTNTGGNEQDDIAEKLRVEETKAKLAAAREGMEREAQRIKEEKEKKEEKAASSRFGAAAASGGKWVPSRARAAGGGLSSIGWGSKMASQQKVDTEDENLFPDLAAADAILEKQKAELPAYKAPTKTPVGGGATWGAPAAPKTRPKLNLKKKAVVEETPVTTEKAAKTEEAPVTEEASPEPAAEEPAPEAAAPVEAAAPAPAPIKPKKKKKKKDLSTFGKK
ncbi:unnamed protein product [Pseudo-nitzschia multistriata]|uniref:Uncharacterized protein n=1 Tax=Pseudo-nitzschia multistriata TaxID=183589 RepID=A0A448ZG55_9STRA|nr:unnamed protein product [Pseudo-nitzschia multistriata]